MCGIVGLIAKNSTAGFTYKNREMFEQMLFADTLRGEDSTGIYLVNKHGNVSWAKECTTAFDFMTEKPTASILSDISYDGCFVVGHNRKATIGNIEDANAHPFIEDDIIMVHNGTISNKEEMHDDKSVDVDSHAICHSFAKIGFNDTFLKIKGAFAIVAYDTKQKTLIAARNEQRPLYIGESDNFWAFASEPWIIYGMGWRNGFKFTSIKEIEPNKMYKFVLGDETTIENTIEEIEEKRKKGKKQRIKVKMQEKSDSSNLPALVQKSMLPLPPVFNYKNGDLVCFEPTIVHLVGKESNNRVIYGKHSRYPEIMIRAILDPTLTDAEVNRLMNTAELVAVVSTVKYDSKSSPETRSVIYCSDVGESAPIMSANNWILNEELILELNYCCQCNTAVLEDELTSSHVFFRKTDRTPFCICKECVEDNRKVNPFWGKNGSNETPDYPV